ncbi:HNH endonuclease signature motif containing protein [Mycolicibacterium gadium]|jgi:hypothetical protein|uniref:HNH endonuclease signature motif containing protein n=1 Tax=Mycolicibacterium gadium TaxID=1794 RepID=UPI002FDE7CA2
MDEEIADEDRQADADVAGEAAAKERSGRNYKLRDLKILFSLAANRCAFPGCETNLIEPETLADPKAVVGHIAHIVASSSDGPRGAETLVGDRDGYDNLILLCRHHHGVVDLQPNSYTSDDLRSWKSTHEAWVNERLAERMKSINFAELEVVCKHLVDNEKAIDSTAMISVEIRVKMDENDLTDRVASRLTTGLMQAPQVADFLAVYSARLDREFPRRLRQGFVAMYNNLRDAGFLGDSLFLQMVEEGTPDPPPGSDVALRWDYEAAALAVLSHLFEICDVFEAP